MTGSLRDLPTFVPAQHVRYQADAIPAEQVVLAQYTFVPYVRTGVAAVLDQPFDWSLPTPSHGRAERAGFRRGGH